MIEVYKPTLFLNKEKSLNNIKKILNNIKNSNVEIRPHFKTHQSLEIGRWFKKFGINKITVSSVSMAKYFSNDWDDITIAFPLNIHEVNDIIKLQEKININILIDSFEALIILLELDVKFNIYIKIDVGYNRAGLDVDDPEVDKIIDHVSRSNKINILGFLSHFGNTYLSRSNKEIISIFNSSIKKLKSLNKRYPDYQISIGDTPSSSIIKSYPDFINEIRPGNFIFYDLAQNKIGSCKLDDIALRVVCPIVSIYEDRSCMLIYCGSVHLSKDYILENEKKCYGYVYQGDYWSLDNKIGKIVSLSQEHGIVKFDKNEGFNIGQNVSIVPVHSCLTVDKMRELYYDNTKIEIMI
tara:strand:- start:622 stop:1680 length:1059 start_codon:yes stop_codon:yes gene_type:complete